MSTLDLPFPVLADSYKAGHFLQYPDALEMVAYGEFRRGLRIWGTEDAQWHHLDDRFVVFGVRWVVETYLLHQWTVEEVMLAEAFYATHNVGPGGAPAPYPFPKDLFLRFIAENNGYFPIRFQALMDGTVAHVHTPVFQITAAKEYARLCTFLETVLTHVWYPCTVATLSRHARSVIGAAFDRSVEPGMHVLLDSRLHDFGFRGVTCVPQAVVGGAAHLLSFTGSDTMAAAFYAQYRLNGGRPVAQSIPATEHSVMTAWPSERKAMMNMIGHFGAGVYAMVMDSYDYEHALHTVVPSVADAKRAQGEGSFLVYRPDSGDPVEAVLAALAAAEATFGAETNALGYKVIQGAGVIQGDGINVITLKHILDAVMEAGYSAQCVAFGMGAGLLHKVNRDTMSFATKLCHIRFADGRRRDVMKKPKTDSGKFSLPGRLFVGRGPVAGPDGSTPVMAPKVFAAADDGSCAAGVTSEGDDVSENLLKVLYDCGPLHDVQWPSFDDMRAQARQQWDALPQRGDPISATLRTKINEWRQEPQVDE